MGNVIEVAAATVNAQKTIDGTQRKVISEGTVHIPLKHTNKYSPGDAQMLNREIVFVRVINKN